LGSSVALPVHAASAPLVPLTVQRAIVKHVGPYANVPTLRVGGTYDGEYNVYRYIGYSTRKPGLHVLIWFGWGKQQANFLIAFSVSNTSIPCSRYSTRSYSIGGKMVYTATRAGGAPSAWRCVIASNGKRVQLYAEGGGRILTFRRLAEFVSSVHRANG
jgi:hypothetical protein